ncbi:MULTISPECIES: hypothetical protein [unclassified Spirosoma]|uniref:hypothetical protein n=1 Tax=unclassified Spirosoma TaxID=2621999 RepID=UPI0009665E9B|nr:MULTISPECIES: hypothetical protein [unclassified Spirosoma]MBN8824218.1 hypothetical protein [Spirosoma sp.]OJW78952.1 MAG: hypothetical protein BGO59_10835 [Spirosoma sp. 48-14]
MKFNKWKMALLVWSAMFPYSTVVSYGLAQLPFTAHWPVFVRTFCLTCLLVPYMVCLALPFLTQRFQKWLQQTTHSRQTLPGPLEQPLPG